MASLITDELLIDVLRAYPLVHPRVVGPLEASKRNENILVEDGAGACYVLRRYRRNPDERRIAFQLAFQRELCRLGYPTSEIMESEKGGLFVHAPSGLWVLFMYVEGTEYDFANMGQVAEAGGRLAQFHTLAAGIELDDVPLDINPTGRRWWAAADEELAALDDLEGAEAGDELAWLRAWRKRLVASFSLEQYDALPAGWVHNDFHGRNMVFAGNELRGLFDFDPIMRAPLAWDVGHAVFMFAREFRGSTRIRPDAARAFLQAYDGVRALEDAERAALPAMLPLVWAPSAPYQRMLQRDGEDHAAYFRHDIAVMTDLEAEGERLRQLFLEGA